MSSETRKSRRKRHNVRQHRSPVRRGRRGSWLCTTAVVASAALVMGFPTKVVAGTMPVPSETSAWARQAQANQAAGNQPVQRFDIASGPLAAVLAVFERISGIKVALGVDSIGMITSPGVTGIFTPQEALGRLLEGTNMAFRFTAPNVAILEFRVNAEPVEVTATAPGRPSRRRNTRSRCAMSPQTIDVIPRAVMEQQGVRDAER